MLSSMETPEVINIDELEVSILMLVKSPSSHQTAGTFLSRRGWPTTIHGQLPKAIKAISTEKPDFVLVSLNFPHPAIAKFAPLFKKTFGVEVVMFCESMDASSVAKLSKITSHKIVGGPSGPNLQRTLRRILQEKFNPEQVSSNQENGDENINDGSSVVTIRGESDQNQNPSYYSKESVTSVETGNYTLESQSIVSNKKKRRLRDIVGATQGRGSKALNDDTQDMMALLNQLTGDGKNPQGKKNKNKKKNLPLFQKGPNQNVHSLVEERGVKLEDFHQAVLDGINQLCGEQKLEWMGPEPTEELYIIPINHTEVNGYLVVKVDELSENVRVSFLALLNEILEENITNKVKAEVQKGFEVGTSKLNFQTLVSQFSIFNISSEYQGSKFCVAFLETTKPFPKIKKIKNEKMLQVSVDEISSIIPVTFKAYLRLEKNNRYFLYIKNGRNFLPEQKERLKKNNIKAICVKQIDEVNIKRFLALANLKEKMEEAIKIAS